MITQRPFGTLPDGREVTEFTLTNISGIQLEVITLGGIITSLMTPDEDDQFGDIVLGYDTLEEYLQSPHYFGAIIGRCANRIANGMFSIDDVYYQVTSNTPPHHLHGGIHGFNAKLWEAKPFENEKGVGVDFHYFSPDGEEGYPGNLDVHVRYFLSHMDALIINYLATTDAATVVNLTQHSYFNLSGGRTSILDHGLFVDANLYLPVNQDLIPTGAMESVTQTPFDFRAPTLIADALALEDEQLHIAGGLDHCWVLDKKIPDLSPAATIYDPVTKRILEVHTSEPGLQVYTGNKLNGKGKNGIEYGPYWGIALETQHFPDATNHQDFPDTVLHPGQSYQSTTVLKFSVLHQ